MSTVSMAWDILVIGPSNYVWERKLKNTKVALKNWVNLSQKNPISDRKETLGKLEEIQMEMEKYEITYALMEKEKRAQF